MLYKLLDGSRVRTTQTDNGTEFVTRNAKRETISTVWLRGEEATRMLGALQVADAIRFGAVFGGGK